jgi:aspartyl/asparaginyl beta-hydroxylase (cupin superfamily)
MSKIWYSFLGTHSKEDDISFYDANDFAWVKELEKHYTIIAEDVFKYLKQHEIKPYFNKSLVTNAYSWKTSAFFFWNWNFIKNSRQCPETINILKNVPGILSASISVLEKDITIKPHRGDTNAIIRVHLPLKVPYKLPLCGFKVNEEERSWEEGKLLLFNDSAKHSAWNLSNERRIILILDVIRPKYKAKSYTVSSMVLSGLVMQILINKVPILKRLPLFFKIGLIKINALIIYCLLKTQQFIIRIFSLV